MGRGFAVVYVENNRGDEDREADQEHGEDEVLAQEWDCEWRWGNVLEDEEEKHGLWQNYGNNEDYFLSRVSREVEDKDGEVGNPHRGHDEVHSVKERLPTESDVEEYIWGERIGN